MSLPGSPDDPTGPHPRLGRRRPRRPGRRPWPAAIEGAGEGLLPVQVARLYGLSTGGTGAGQCVGLIQPAGGYLPADVATACAAMQVAAPTVVAVPVGAGRNSFGQDAEADKEVALDLQTAIGAAPGARFAVYFTDDSHAGLVAAVAAAIADEVNRPSVLVISWGDAEANWPEDARTAMDAALAEAVRQRVTMVAATGDMLATDGLMDGRAHVDYPASSPLVLACGGTRVTLTADRAGIASERVWNVGTSGTGGGISDLYPVPVYQANIALPASANDGARRRGVPDLAVAAAADPGYRIIVNAKPVAIGGTSAGAPLLGGFLALINERRQTPLGQIHDRLYAGAGLFRPVTEGNNRPFGSPLGYSAGPGWSACTGLGVPIGQALVADLTADLVA